MGCAGRGRIAGFLPIALIALLASRSLAHPHNPLDPVTHDHTALGLEITITDTSITYDVLLSNSYLNRQVPRERGDLKLALRENRFEFLDEQQMAAEQAACREFFANKLLPLDVDGQQIDAVFDSVEFIPAVDPTGIVDHTKAPPDAHVRLHFPLTSPPKTVAFVWKLFPASSTRDMFGDLQPAELSARIDAGAESKIVTFRSNAPEYIWHAPEGDATAKVAPVRVVQKRGEIDVPMLSFGLVGGWIIVLAGLKFAGAPRKWRRAALVFSLVPLATAYMARGALLRAVPAPWRQPTTVVSDDVAIETFTTLLRNVYRAFDYKTESDIYDVLARSVDGDQLDRVYGEVYQSLVAREQGGAVARVKNVEIITTQLTSSGIDETTGAPTFSLRCRWRVYGLVYHWGHVHERANEYRASYTVAQRGDAWKITDTVVLGERRIDLLQRGDDSTTSAGGNQP